MRSSPPARRLDAVVFGGMARRSPAHHELTAVALTLRGEAIDCEHFPAAWASASLAAGQTGPSIRVASTDTVCACDFLLGAPSAPPATFEPPHCCRAGQLMARQSPNLGRGDGAVLAKRVGLRWLSTPS